MMMNKMGRATMMETHDKLMELHEGRMRKYESYFYFHEAVIHLLELIECLLLMINGGRKDLIMTFHKNPWLKFKLMMFALLVLNLLVLLNARVAR